MHTHTLTHTIQANFFRLLTPSPFSAPHPHLILSQFPHSSFFSSPPPLPPSPSSFSLPPHTLPSLPPSPTSPSFIHLFLLFFSLLFPSLPFSSSSFASQPEMGQWQDEGLKKTKILHNVCTGTDSVTVVQQVIFTTSSASSWCSTSRCIKTEDLLKHYFKAT